MATDPSIFGAPEFDPIVSDAGSTPAPTYKAPTKVSQAEVLANTEGAVIGAGVNAAASRDRANGFASLGAVMSEWSVRSAYDFFAGPTFEPESGFSAGSVLPQLNTQLTETEREFLLKSRSQDEFNYKMESVERQRSAAQAAGDNPVISFLGGMIDPGYLAIDVASFGAGRLARIAKAGITGERLAVGSTAGAGAFGLGSIEQAQKPFSDTEVVVGAMLNGAAAGMLYELGTGMRKADREYPSETLASIAERQKISNPDKGILPNIVFEAPEGSMKTGRNLLDSIEPVFKGTEYDELMQVLKNAPELDDIKVSTSDLAQSFNPGTRGYWSEKGGKNLLFVRPGVEADVPLHELTHAIIDKRLLSNPKVKAELADMQASVRRELAKSNDPAAKFLHKALGNDPREFIAYAFTSPTFRDWAKAQKITDSGVALDALPTAPVTKTTPQLTLWDKVVDFVARTLGLQSPNARKALENSQPATSYKEKHSTGKFRTLDDRMRELLRESAPESNLYTRGTTKVMQASLDQVQLRERIVKIADKEQISKKISWSLHKTLSSFSPKSKEVADILVDDPLDMAGDSVVNQARAIRADMTHLQYQYEDLLTKELAARGAGIKNRILKPRAAMEVQRTLEKELQLEMLRRERNKVMGMDAPSTASKQVQEMADALDKLYAHALKEMQAAGVTGADAVAETSGYFSRKWDISAIDESKARLERNGHTKESAEKVIQQIVQQGIRRANGWDAQLSKDIAKAILDRAHRKGYFEDSSFRSHAGNEAAKEVRDILTSAGLRGDRLQRAMDVLTGVVDEAGKLSTLKHRIDIDMKSGVALPDGTVLTVSDLINSDMTRATESYLDQVSGRIAMAKRGLPDVSDVDKLRTEMLESIPHVNEREQAANLFDQTINSILGRPTGEDIPAALRKLQAVTRMVGLASSGLWQITEYATAMARFGGMKTLKYAMKEATFKAIRHPDYQTSTQLVDVLSRNSSADIRLRPYIQRMEDNFEVPTSDIAQAALLQAQQLVPYINAQKLVQTHQARVVANLVVDTFRKAGDGDQKAIKALEDYGLEPGIMTSIQPELKAAGMDTSKWSDDTWSKVRAPLQKMMDDSVLRNRTGEIPAFAQFSQVGKFIFTFRSFVLGAHNKVLAGTISRDGLAGISLLMLYQFPLVLLATQANSTLQGKEIKDTQELIAKSFGQMGSLGLFSELFGVITGQKQQFGAPGLIAVDRLYKLAGDAASLDAGQAMSGAIQATPVLSIIPGARAIGEALKE